jgi:hypothetical protein
LTEINPANASTILPRAATGCSYVSAGTLAIVYVGMPPTTWTTSNFNFLVVLNFASDSANFIRYPFIWLQVNM